MRRLVLGASLAAMLVPSWASAQTIQLTEAELLANLTANSPRVRAIRSGVDVAAADVLAAGRWPNPRFSFDRESVAGVTENITIVAQQLPISGRIGLQSQAATALVDATERRADEEVRRARFEARTAFARLVAAQAREDALIRTRDRLRALTDVLGRREAAGDAAGFDRLRAEREVLDADADRAIAASDRARAQAALLAFLTERVDASRLVAVPNAASTRELPGVDALVERAESTRGELLALQKEMDAARLLDQAAGRRAIPDPEFAAGAKSSTVGGGNLGGVFMVQSAIPLFDRAGPERAQAQAKARQAEAGAAAFRIALRAEIESLRVSVIERRTAASAYRAAALANADQIDRIAQVSYDAGERGILELLDAYRIGAAARVRLAVLDAAVRQAEIELEFVSGWELP